MGAISAVFMAVQSQRARPAISSIRYLTMSRTTLSGSGDAAVNRIVPLEPADE
jgi:hypothetical protein